MRLDKFSLAGYVLSLIATTAATLLITLVSRADSVPNISLLYVPVVLACGVWFGLGPALFSSFLSVAQYDFFFLQPKLTFAVNRYDDGISLFVLCVAGATAAHLASASRTRATAAERRASESAVMTELSDALLEAESLADALERIAGLVRSVLHATGCSLLIPQPNGQLTIGGQDRKSPDDNELTRRQFAAANDTFRRGREVVIPVPRTALVGRGESVAEYLPLKAGDAIVGVMEIVWPDVHSRDRVDRNLVRAFAAQAAIAIERAKAVDERRSRRVLEETDRLKSSLLSAVSHDLRTPLASIKASVTGLILNEQDVVDGDTWDMLHAIDEETDRLDRLVGNVLDLSRIEAGALRPLLDWYDIAEVVDSSVAATLRRNPGQTIAVNIDPDVTFVQLDLVLIRQVLVNLLDNAIRHGRGEAISVTAAKINSALEIAVADHGPGIPASQHGRMFTPFVGAGDHGDRYRGVGLGLAISRGVLEAHHGRIDHQETAGGGATFVISVPQAEPIQSSAVGSA